jgi:hypothetical protein
MSNQFCRFLSNGYSFQILNQSLVVKPCCWSSNTIHIDQYYDQKIKERAKINYWTNDCRVCQEQENGGQKSFRQSSFDIVPEVNSTAPIALDINLDMTCNAACVICGPEASTLWEKQYNKNKIFTINQQSNHESYLSTILNNVDFNNVKRVKFFGGEPLLTDTHIKILEKIPNPSQCDVWYTTNASIVPKENILNIWKKFKLIYFEASIDGIDERFDYIRWPLSWTKIEQNLLNLRAIAPGNLLFRINHTLNPFNAYYYEEIENWVQQKLDTNRLGDKTEINIHPCWGTWDLKKTPMSLREKIYKKYPDHIISKIILSHSFESYQSILNFTDQWDPIRKNNWKQTFPDIVKYFSE